VSVYLPGPSFSLISSVIFSKMPAFLKSTST
jgi:hypothetical protein